LRLPYGEETIPTEEFPFEEMPGGEDVSEKGAGAGHDDFLWGNPAFAGAYLLGRAFTQSGWEMRPGQVRQLDGIPMYLYKQGRETRQLPGAEAWLGERAAEIMLDHGVLPLLSVKNRDAVVLFAFRSLAKLAGPWAA
jgi:type VI secretion system protein ImpC